MGSYTDGQRRLKINPIPVLTVAGVIVLFTLLAALKYHAKQVWVAPHMVMIPCPYMLGLKTISSYRLAFTIAAMRQRLLDIPTSQICTEMASLMTILAILRLRPGHSAILGTEPDRASTLVGRAVSTPSPSLVSDEEASRGFFH